MKYKETNFYYTQRRDKNINFTVDVAVIHKKNK